MVEQNKDQINTRDYRGYENRDVYWEGNIEYKLEERLLIKKKRYKLFGHRSRKSYSLPLIRCWPFNSSTLFNKDRNRLEYVFHTHQTCCDDKSTQKQNKKNLGKIVHTQIRFLRCDDVNSDDFNGLLRHNYPNRHCEWN